jgi:glycosyltransferase involved in cell wall biosynthesis
VENDTAGTDQTVADIRKADNPSGRTASSVTALVPAWQSAEFINATLDSLSAQTYNNFRVIVSVDLCDDDTYAVCQAHALRDTRFRVLKQESRLGYVGNCNVLLEEADSDYVLFAFHDDVLAPDYISRLAAVLDERPEAVLSYSDILLTNISGEQKHFEFSALERVSSRLRRGAMMLQPVKDWWVPNRGLFHLESARRIRGLKTHGAGDYSADLPWLFHMSLLGEFARVPEELCFKYYKTGSLSLRWSHTSRQLYEVRAACMRELWSSSLSPVEKTLLTVPLTLRMIRTVLQGLRFWRKP